MYILGTLLNLNLGGAYKKLRALVVKVGSFCFNL